MFYVFLTQYVDEVQQQFESFVYLFLFYFKDVFNFKSYTMINLNSKQFLKQLYGDQVKWFKGN